MSIARLMSKTIQFCKRAYWHVLSEKENLIRWNSHKRQIMLGIMAMNDLFIIDTPNVENYFPWKNLIVWDVTYSFQKNMKSCTVIGIFMFSHLCLKRTAINWFQKPFVCIVGWRKVSTLPSCNRFKIAAFHWKVKVFSYLLWNNNVVSNSNLNPKLNLEVA